MNSEEIKQQFDTLLPAEVNGSARPSEPLSSDNDFYLDVPQLIRNDVVLADSMNLIISTLLSNDKVLNAMIDAIKDQLANADLREATQLLKGLMSPDDKKKLDGIANNANNYSHPNSGVTSGTYKSVTVNAQGHVTGGSNPTTLAGYGITDAAAKSHGNHVPATQTADNTKFLRNDNTWQQVTPGNIGAPTKTGSGASGTWNINISGKAATAGTADTANKFKNIDLSKFVYAQDSLAAMAAWKVNAVARVEGTLPDGLTGAYTYGTLASFATPNACLQIYGAHHANDSSKAAIYARSGWNTDKQHWVELVTSDNATQYAVAGNKTHGTKLFTDNGTFTVPAGVGTVVVTAIGGGGGGGARYTPGGASVSGTGGAGGRGVVISSVACAVTSGAGIPVYVGKGGAGGSLTAGGAGKVAGSAGSAYTSLSGSDRKGGAGGRGGSNNGTGGAGGAGAGDVSSSFNGSGGGGGGGCSSFGDYVYASGGGGTSVTVTTTSSRNGGGGSAAAGGVYADFILSTAYGAGGAGGAGEGHTSYVGAAGHDGCVYVRW